MRKIYYYLRFCWIHLSTLGFREFAKEHKTRLRNTHEKLYYTYLNIANKHLNKATSMPF